MNRRRNWISASVFGLAAVLFVVGPALAKKAPKEVTIGACKVKKSAVKFNHAAHVKTLKAEKNCVSCHHKVKGKMDQQKCSKCHMDAKDKIGSCKDKSKKKNPYHKLCITCHKKKKADHPKVVTKCKGCHK
jgi:hypothetical protein